MTFDSLIRRLRELGVVDEAEDFVRYGPGGKDSIYTEAANAIENRQALIDAHNDSVEYACASFRNTGAGCFEPGTGTTQPIQGDNKCIICPRRWLISDE